MILANNSIFTCSKNISSSATIVSSIISKQITTGAFVLSPRCDPWMHGYKLLTVPPSPQVATFVALHLTAAEAIVTTQRKLPKTYTHPRSSLACSPILCAARFLLRVTF